MPIPNAKDVRRGPDALEVFVPYFMETILPKLQKEGSYWASVYYSQGGLYVFQHSVVTDLLKDKGYSISYSEDGNREVIKISLDKK